MHLNKNKAMIYQEEMLAEVLADIEMEEESIQKMELNPNHRYCE